MTIRAIETRYAGHKFRSRLEARWAVFFDALKLPWQYEPQGYAITDPWDDESRAYLPDFYLPTLDAWAEVKGDPNGVDWPLWATAVDAMAASGLPDSSHAYSGLSRNGSALIVLGSIPPEVVGIVTTGSERTGKAVLAWRHPMLINHKGVDIGEMMFEPEYLTDFRYVDNELGMFDPSWSGFSGKPYWHHEPDHNGRPFPGMWMNRRVIMAYRKARQARFEHGATG